MSLFLLLYVVRPRAITSFPTRRSSDLLLEEFAAGFSGKTSPVHHFWHTFDIAVTRFSDRHVDQPPEVDPVTRKPRDGDVERDRKSTRLNSSHRCISYAVFCLKKNKTDD